MNIKITFLFSYILLVSGCNTSKEGTENSTISIITTTGMLADAVRNIVGDSIEVEELMGPGVDPHLYKASQGDLEKLTSANLVVYNGLHLEGKMGDVLEKLSKSKPVIAAGDAIPDSLRRNSTQYNNTFDPHIWFDVARWIIVVKHLTIELGKLYPDKKEAFNSNSRNYISKLEMLHTKAALLISKIPKEQRILITAHDAFEYFGEAYDIEVRGLQGISTVSDFGLKDITELVDFIVQKKIKAVFIETSVSARAINAVVEGCKSKDFDVVIGGSLYSDAMGESGTSEGTYIGMVNSYVETIYNALK